jgi:hypothetical protein
MKSALYTDIVSRNGPSLYAPALAWAVADFTRALVEAEGGIVAHQTGMVVASDQCSLATIRELAGTAAQGRVSPLRFAGASPSIIAGLPALEQGIRGPTLCLTMNPAQAGDAMWALVRYWIRYHAIVGVIAIAHHPQGDRGHLFKGMIARSAADSVKAQVLQLSDPH